MYELQDGNFFNALKMPSHSAEHILNPLEIF